MKEEHKYLFVGGLHRSGTSALYRLLGSDGRISTFQNTGVIEDEGQFLQSVYPVDKYYGGVGIFGINPEAHLTEDSPMLKSAQKQLFDEWSLYWDITKYVLAEKTPSNLLKARFLQAIFSNSSFVFIMRHPVASAMATTKWTGAYMTTLIENWVKTHEILFADLPYLNNYLVLKYEDFTISPETYFSDFEKLLGFAPELDWSTIRAGMNDKYMIRYRSGDFHLRVPNWKKPMKKMRNVLETYNIERKFEKRINKFGYSFKDI